MKTASRIPLAAVHALWCKMPRYGAERRGAPKMALTRVAAEPIQERGAIGSIWGRR
jgi:Pyruvate/2-oxoacid:ferredoxin oxidoreductase gamma subunit